MKSSKITWALGALAAMGLGMAAEACSSSSSTTTPTNDGGPAADASSGTGSSTGTGSGSSTGTGSGTADAGKCYKAPTALHAEDGGTGPYCPFSGPDGGAAISCAIGQHCCEPPASAANAVSTCEPAATSCPIAFSTDWVCEGTPDCTGGQICCGTGTIGTQTPQPGCAADGGTLGSFPYVSKFTGTSCQTSCASGSYQVCSKDSECPSGDTCVAIQPKGGGIGYCSGTATVSDGGTPDTGTTTDAGTDSATTDAAATDAAAG